MGKTKDGFWELYGWFGLVRDLKDFWVLASSGAILTAVAGYFQTGQSWLMAQPLFVQFSAWITLFLMIVYAIAHFRLWWRGNGAKGRDDQAPNRAGSVLRLLEWREGNPSDTRREYREWRQAVFMLQGQTKERGRAYIEVMKDGITDRNRACIAWGDGFSHEMRLLKPSEQYLIPVFVRLKETTELWLDKKAQHPIGYRPIYTDAGSYVTDEAFLTRQHRQRLPRGACALRVVLIIGDVAHQVEQFTEWRDFGVDADQGSSKEKEQSKPTPTLPPEIVAKRMRSLRSMEAESAYRRSIISVDWRSDAEGLHFVLTNNEVDVVTTFRLILTDLQWWSADKRQFVKVKEFHGGGDFVEVELQPRSRQLFHKDRTTAAFLHIERDGILWFHSKPGVRQGLGREGLWEVTLRHELDAKPVIYNEVRCFQWKKGSKPEPCNCPESSDDA